MVLKKIIGKRSRILVCGQAKNGPALSFLKNMSTFVKEFNEKTKQDLGKVVNIKILTFIDGTYSWTVREATSSYLLKNLLKEKKKLSRADIENLSEKIIEYMNTEDKKKAYKILLGTAKSAKIEVIE